MEDKVNISFSLLVDEIASFKHPNIIIKFDISSKLEALNLDFMENGVPE